MYLSKRSREGLLCPWTVICQSDTKGPWNVPRSASVSRTHTLPNSPCLVCVLRTSAISPPNTQVVPLKIDTSENPWYLVTSTPFTGGPIRAANEETPNAIPRYVPVTLGFGIKIESAAVAPEMIVPDQKPNAIE